MMINGKIPQQCESAALVTKLSQFEVEKKSKVDTNNQLTFKVLNSNLENTKVLIKEIAPNILSKEAEKFLSSFFKILEEQVN